MRIAVLEYHHRHGTDPLIVQVPEEMESLPEITHGLLFALGVLEPELDREDEWCEWRGPFHAESLPLLQAEYPAYEAEESWEDEDEE